MTHPAPLFCSVLVRLHGSLACLSLQLLRRPLPRHVTGRGDLRHKYGVVSRIRCNFKVLMYLGSPYPTTNQLSKNFGSGAAPSEKNYVPKPDNTYIQQFVNLFLESTIFAAFYQHQPGNNPGTQNHILNDSTLRAKPTREQPGNTFSGIITTQPTCTITSPPVPKPFAQVRNCDLESPMLSQTIQGCQTPIKKHLRRICHKCISKCAATMKRNMTGKDIATFLPKGSTVRPM